MNNIFAIPTRLFLAAMTVLMLYAIMIVLIESNEPLVLKPPAPAIPPINLPDRTLTEVEDPLIPSRPVEPIDAPLVPNQPIVTAGSTYGLGGTFKYVPPDVVGPVGAGGTTILTPVYIPQPIFPSKAIRRGVGGYAVIQLTVTDTGRATDIQIIEEHPTGFNFGKEAAKAGTKLKYSPKMVDGMAQSVSGIFYKFTFQTPE